MQDKQVLFTSSGKDKDAGSAAIAWPASAAVLHAAQQCKGDPQPLLQVLADEGEAPPVPGTGNTGGLWEFLATVAAADLSAARALEPHLDAAAILHQAALPWQTGKVWGVYAAEGAGTRLEASYADGAWQLDGDKPWCSLASQLSHALVSAHVQGGRRLFAVDLKHGGVVPKHKPWVSRGLARIPSGPVRFNAVPAQPVGEEGWYLSRPGFAVGGVGVAACWFGGAVGIYRHLFTSARTREPDQLALAWLGQADRLLASGADMLTRAAGQADSAALGPLQAARVRGHIAQICEQLLQISGHATGPGPLSGDEEHVRRVADLSLYLRQHHAARDDAGLGRMLLQQAAESGTRIW